jgi:tRNA(Ile)-lysidine synthase
MLSEFEKKIADFIKANQLFVSKDKILLAISGGADSTALLYTMQALQIEGAINAEILCAHINHQLRGNESDQDEQLALTQANQLNIPILTKRINVREFAHRSKLSIETAARKLRIESLLDIAKANNCTCIATAHQKDDNAETILHRLLRGTGFRGLAGIWPIRVLGACCASASRARDGTSRQATARRDGIKFVRPLLCVRRDEIIRYLQKLNLKWREDRTNVDCTHKRNFIRRRLLPALQNDCTASIVEQLFELAQSSRKFYNLLSSRAQQTWVELAQSGENKIVLNLKRFLAEPKPIRIELIRLSLTTLGSGERDLTERHYERILQLAEQNTDTGKRQLPGGFIIWCESGNLIFARPEKIAHPVEQSVESSELKVPGQTGFGKFLIKATILDDTKGNMEEFKAGKNNFIERFDFDKVEPPLLVRFRQRGDRFQPLGLPAGKKVGKFLTTAKVSQGIRNKILVVSDSEKIIWVWPIRISERAKVTHQTQKTLQLQITAADLH